MPVQHYGLKALSRIRRSSESWLAVAANGVLLALVLMQLAKGVSALRIAGIVPLDAPDHRKVEIFIHPAA
jgi:hypothetical protein